MPDLAAILQNIRDNVIEIPSATESRLEGWVQEAQRKLEADHQWMQLETSWVAVTVATNRLNDYSDANLHKPTDWVMAIGDPWYRSGNTGSTVRLEWLPSIQDVRKEHPQLTSTGAPGRPKGLWEQEDQINVYPVPDQANPLGTYSTAGEYEIIIPYRKREAELSIGGTVTNYWTDTPGFQTFLENYASAKALLFNRDLENAQVYLTLAKEDMLREKRIDKQRKAQFLKWTPRRDVHASRRQMRAV